MMCRIYVTASCFSGTICNTDTTAPHAKHRSQHHARAWNGANIPHPRPPERCGCALQHLMTSPTKLPGNTMRWAIAALQGRPTSTPLPNPCPEVRGGAVPRCCWLEPALPGVVLRQFWLRSLWVISPACPGLPGHSHVLQRTSRRTCELSVASFHNAMDSRCAASHLPAYHPIAPPSPCPLFVAGVLSAPISAHSCTAHTREHMLQT